MSDKIDVKSLSKKQRNKLIYEFYLQDYYQEEIAKQFGLTQSAVSKVIQQFEKDLNETYQKEVHLLRHRLCYGYKLRRKKAYAAFRTNEGKTDPAWLRVANDCDKAIRDIFGIDAPAKQEIAGPNGTPFTLVHNDEAWINEREKLVVALQKHPEARETVLKALLEDDSEDDKP